MEYSTTEYLCALALEILPGTQTKTRKREKEKKRKAKRPMVWRTVAVSEPLLDTRKLLSRIEPSRLFDWMELTIGLV